MFPSGGPVEGGTSVFVLAALAGNISVEQVCKAL